MLVPRQSAVDAPQNYVDRQATIAALATGVDAAPVPINYLADEDRTWATVQELLEPLWARYAALPLRSARQALDLPMSEIPQLSFVTERLQSLTGFRFASVAGTVSGHEFFGALAQRTFPSTQFIRWSGAPTYTPAPDVLHELGGHAVSLANPRLARLHHLAGLASVAAPSRLPEIAAVFWYSIEFGVVSSREGWKAYGTGLLSSPGELGWFAEHAEIVPIDVAEMIATPYDINHYQPLLFGAESLDHVFDVVGGYFQNIAG